MSRARLMDPLATPNCASSRQSSSTAWASVNGQVQSGKEQVRRASVKRETKLSATLLCCGAAADPKATGYAGGREGGWFADWLASGYLSAQLRAVSASSSPSCGYGFGWFDDNHRGHVRKRIRIHEWGAVVDRSRAELPVTNIKCGDSIKLASWLTD